MSDPFVLSSDQINQLTVRIAQALGITSADYSTLSSVQIDELKSQILTRNVTDVPGTRGTFTPVYQLVAGWVTDNSDPDNPGPIAGVDKSAWTFLRAGENVNQGNTLDAFMAREYTRIQYKLRVGTDPSDDLIYRMSNGIAFNVLRAVIAGNSLTGRAPGVIPGIDEIANNDARVVVDGYFGGDTGAWAGNSLFQYFGADDPFLKLSPANNANGTYDIFASMYAMQTGLKSATIGQLATFWWSDSASNPYSRFYVINHNSIGPEQTEVNMQMLSNQMDGWMSANYYQDWSGMYKTFFQPSTFNNVIVTPITVYMGELNQGDTIDLTSQDLSAMVIVRAGNQGDTVKLNQLPLKGIADGGLGVDTLDLSQMAVGVNVESRPIIGGNQALSITKKSIINLVGSFYA